MKLEKVFIKNFRPINDKGLLLTFSTKKTTFIGENNVGKSSILEAIKHILPEAIWETEDWHGSDKNRVSEIRLECILDEDQISQIIDILSIPITPTEFKNKFTEKLTCEIKQSLDSSISHFILGRIHIEYNTGWIGEVNRTASYSIIPWRNILNELEKNKYENPFEEIRSYLVSARTGSAIVRIDFGINLSPFFTKMLKENIIVIEEYREKPQKVLNEYMISPTGRDLANILFKLKNGRSLQKEKFNKIKSIFNELFPSLELDIILENSEVKIHTKKSEIESTTSYIGAGILESLLILTHLIAYEDKIIFIDHPELHLHPHAQRRLASFIKGFGDNQTIMVTHSPYFVNLGKNSSIIRLIEADTGIKNIEQPQDYFTDEDFSKLEQFLDIDTKELFFARKVLLVEGPTEFGALPIFASKIDYDFDKYGVSIIYVGGKESFAIFVKLCEGFKIPYFIVADRDAEMILSDIKEKYSDCRCYILSGTFEDLLPQELRSEAANLVGKSKPRIGRYIARKMIEQNHKIPEEIRTIIQEIRKL